MKNVVYLSAVVLAVITCSQTIAQNIETISTASFSQLNKQALPQQVSRNQVPSRAHRHFMEKHAPVKDEKWFLNATGPVAIFYRDGMQQLAYYNEKGNWKSSVLNYYDKGLPGEVFNRIKGVYCDYAITHCTEVQTNAGSVYHVTILKNDDFKALKIENDQIELKHEYVYNKGEETKAPLTKN